MLQSQDPEVFNCIQKEEKKSSPSSQKDNNLQKAQKTLQKETARPLQKMRRGT